MGHTDVNGTHASCLVSRVAAGEASFPDLVGQCQPDFRVSQNYFGKTLELWGNRGDFPQRVRMLTISAACALLQNLVMTVARKNLIDRENGGYHHVVTRCVRRAWICDVDPLTGRDYSHRKGWIEERMLSLCEAFAVEVYGYAVMSNHYHIALKVQPKEALALPEEEVARRWLIAYPPSSTALKESKVEAILEDPERLEVLRERLGDLSWYMKCLNHHIARRANLEDDCTGKFWESRFHSSRPMKSLDALYACMAYIDLNPLSAGVTRTPGEEGEHTSLSRRKDEARQNEVKAKSRMAPMRICSKSRRIHSGGSASLPLTLENYLIHVEWVARCRPSGKKHPKAYRLGAPPTVKDPSSFMYALLKLHKRWGRKQGHGDVPLPDRVGARGELSSLGP